MKKFNGKAMKRPLLLLLTLIFASTLLFGCKNDDTKNKERTKDEISASIESCFTGDAPEYAYVSKYLVEWGLPDFDKSKFEYFESRVILTFNYGDGVPDRKIHARLTAEAFLDNYYDTVDRSDKTAVTNALLTSYVDVLGDKYSVYRLPVETDEYNSDMSGTFGGIGVVVQYDYDALTIMISTVNIGSPAEAAGIKVGDYVYAVEGKTIEELGIGNVVSHIRGDVGTDVKVTLKRGDDLITVTMTRAVIDDISVDYSFDEETRIGYVQIASFKSNTYEQFAEAINELEALGCVGIIFDLRNNLGGYVRSVSDIISYIIPSDHTIVSYQYKGTIASEYRSKDDVYNGQTSDHVLNVPMVVLCNEYTASSGEIFTSAIRDYRDDGMLRATIVGTNTFGKGIMQNSYSYFDGSSVTLTVAYYNPPCGENYHEIGITPDILLELPEAELDPDTGKYLPIEDTQFKAALEEIKALINN